MGYNFVRFPSIEQFKNVIRNVQHKTRYVGQDENGKVIYDPYKALPKLKFRGTVKLHGTNSCVNFMEDGSINFQSRERVLSLQSDNAGFCLFMSNKTDTLLGLEIEICNTLSATPAQILIFGEWCGGNIQRGVAISGLPKMFVIFGVRVRYGEDWFWVDLEKISHVSSPENQIFNALDFESYEIEIDFEKPELAQNQIIEWTLKVENQCPVGKHFGKDGVGEGIVFSCIEDGWRSSDFFFKSKGEKHSASKVKTLAPVDVEAIKAMSDFVEYAVTENRLLQGLQNLVREQQKPFEMTSIGDFIRWVFNDIVKEEADTIVASQLDPKKLGGPIANASKKWYISKLNSGFSVDP